MNQPYLIKEGRGDRTQNLFSPLLTDQVTLNRSLIQGDYVLINWIFPVFINYNLQSIP